LRRAQPPQSSSRFRWAAERAGGDGDRVVIANPRPRVGVSVLIGPTHGGRILTVVLNPERADPGAWHVRTAWEASRAQIARYRRDR